VLLHYNLVYTWCRYSLQVISCMINYHLSPLLHLRIFMTWSSIVTKKKELGEKKQRKRNTDAHSQGMHADLNGIRAAWSSDLHHIRHSNNSQNKHTHTLWSFNWKWFTHTWINTSDHRMQILVPYIRLNNPGTISCLIYNAHHHGSINGFRYGPWGQFSLCSLGPLSH
jgi:hypothetical protein